MEEVILRRSTKKDAPSQEHLDAIINALGPHKKFKDSAKREFATLLLKESPILGNLGHSIENQPQVFNAMRKKIKKARTAFLDWIEFASNNLDASAIDIRAQNYVQAKYGFHTSIQAFAYYFNAAGRIANGSQLIKRKSGRSNLGAMSIAKTVARLYCDVFKEYPACADYAKIGSGEKIRDVYTPFDRVCIILGGLVGIEIRPATRKKAVAFIKKEFRL